jgi:hypothetical protein
VGRLWQRIFGVNHWTVLGGIAGVLSFALAAWVAFTGTGAAQQSGVLGPDPKTIISFSPVPSLSISVSPSPVYVPTLPAEADATDSPSPTVDGNENPSIRYLMDLPFVSGGAASKDPVTFSNVLYDRTVTVNCDDNSAPKAWSVVGYGTFSATLGIHDAANNAIGTSINATFTNQDNQSLGAATAVSLGKPRQVSFPLKGAVQMQLRCRTRGSQYVRLSLGNAELVR